MPAGSALSYARLAELREGVWMRPANIEVVLLRDSSIADLERMMAWPADPGGLVERLWDLVGWSAGAEDLLAALDALVPEGPDVLAPGFELSAAVLRHLQADPLLPAELLPEGWPGERLRTIYDGWDVQVPGHAGRVEPARLKACEVWGSDGRPQGLASA